MAKLNYYSLFSKKMEIKKFQDKYTSKGYFTDNKTLWYIAQVVTYLAQVASVISAYTFIKSVFAIKVESPTLLIITTVAFLVIFEIIKRYLFDATITKWNCINKPQTPLLLTLLSGIILAASAYFSIEGGATLGTDHKRAEQTERKFDSTIRATRHDYDRQITALHLEVAEIKKRNTYKGNVWIAGKDKALIQDKEQTISKLINARADNATSLINDRQKEFSTIAQDNATNETRYRYIFGIAEVVFLIAFIFIGYFEKRSLVEYLAANKPSLIGIPNEPQTKKQTHNETQHQDEPQQLPYNEPQTEHNEPRKKYGHRVKGSKQPHEILGFRIRTGNAICQHCHTTYDRNHSSSYQKYCTDKCRLAANAKKKSKQPPEVVAETPPPPPPKPKKKPKQHPHPQINIFGEIERGDEK